MKTKSNLYSTFIVLAGLWLAGLGAAQAATVTTGGSGDWNSTTPNAPWPGGVVPADTDDVVINAAHGVTVTANAAINSITFSNATGAKTLTVNADATLAVAGGILMQNAANANLAATITGAGTITAASLTVGGTTTPVTTAGRTTTLTSSIGMLDLSGNLTLTGQDPGTPDNDAILNLVSGTISVGGTVAWTTVGTGVAQLNLNSGAQTGTLILSGATPFSGSGTLTFNANGTSATVVYSAEGAQTVRNTTYRNLTLSGSGAKTTTGATVNGILSLEGTTTTTGTVATYGAAATLQYLGSGAQTTGTEFPATWSGSGGVLIANTNGAVTLGGAKVVNGPLTINANATLDTSAANNYGLTFGGNFVNDGTFLANASAITISGTGTQSIDGFTTTGGVSMTKTGGTATFQGNVDGGAFTLSGNGGTLNLGAGLTHTFSGTFTRTVGTLNLSSSTLHINGATSGTGGTWTAGTSTVEYGGGAQTVFGVGYYHLKLSGSDTKTLLAGMTTIGGDLTLGGTVSATLAAALAVSGDLTLGPGTTLDVSAGNFALSVGGDWTNNGTFTGRSGTVTLNGAVAKSVSGATTFGGLTVNNSAGVTLNSSATVNGTLTLTAGQVTSAANLTLGDGATISRATGSLDAVPAFGTSLNATYTAGGVTTGPELPVSTSILQALSFNHASGTVTLAADVTVNGALTTTAGGTLADGGYTVTVEGNVTNGGTHSGSGKILLAGGSAQTLSGTGGYGNVQLDNAAGASLNANTTINGHLTVTTGTFTVGAFSLTVSGTTTVDATLAITSATGTESFGNVTVNGTWNNAINEPVTISGDLANNGTFNAGTGVYTLSGSGKTISGTLSIPSLTVTGTRTNTGVLTVGTALAGTGGLTQNANATLNIGGTSTITTLTATASPNLVNYNGTGVQTVKAATYDTLTFSGGDTNRLGGAIVVNGDLTIETGETLDATTSNYGVTLGGNWINNGTFTARSGTVTLNGAATQDLGGAAATAFRSLTLNNTGADVTAGANFSIAGTLTVSANATLVPAAAVVISGAGTLTGNGTVQVTRTAATADFNSQYTITTKTLTNLTVEYAGAAEQVVSALSYGSLVLDNAGGASLAGNTTVGDTLSLISGALSIGANTLTNNGAFAITSGTLTGGASANLTLGGSGAGTTLPALTLNNLIVNRANGIALSGAVTVGGTLTLTAGQVTGAAHLTLGDGAAISRAAGSLDSGVPTFGGNVNVTYTAGGVTTGTELPASVSALQALSFNHTSGTVTLGADATVNGTLTLAAGGTLADNGNILTVKSTVSNAGTHSGSGRILLAGAAAQTVNGKFGNVELDNAAGASLGGVTTISGNLTATTGTFTVGAYAFTNSGTATIASTLSITSATGGKSFGNITVNTGGVFDNTTGNAAVRVTGDLNNSGTFNAGTNIYTLTGSSKTISGTLSIPSLTVSGTYANNDTLTVGTALAGGGTLTQGVNATLNLGGTSTITTLTATANPNLVDYNGTGAQTVKATTYDTLTVSGGNTKTLAATTTVNGDLTIGTGTTLAASTYNLNLGGNWINHGTFSPGTRTVTLNGTAAQSLGGSTATTFYNLTDANTSAAVSLAGDLSVISGGTFTVNNGATLQCGTFIVSGAGAFTLASGGTLGVGEANGITAAGTASGNVQTTTRTFNTGAHYLYNGTTAQATGNGLPTTINSLTLNNTGATVTLSRVTTNTTSVTIASGAQLSLPDGTNRAATLVLGGVTKASGTWGSTSSSATFQNDTYFAGTGVLSISSGNASATALASSANPSTYGQSVSFTATVTGSGPTPTGTVQFKTNGANFGGAATLSGGTALSDALPANLPVGTNNVTAVYSGDENFNTNISSTLTQVVSALSVELSGTRVYDGTWEAAGANLTVANQLGGDDVTVTGSATLADKDVGVQAVSNRTVTRVNSAVGAVGSTAATSFNVTVAAPTSGNTLIAVIATRGTSGDQVSDLTQTGATWSRVSQATNLLGTTTEIWYAPNVNGAGTTVTVNLAASLFAAGVVMEYSGVLSAEPVDQTASATNRNTSARTGTTATTAQGDELWIGGIGLTNSGYTLSSILNAFSSVGSAQSTNGTAGRNAKVYALERITNTTAAAMSGGTVSTASQWSGTIATFRTTPLGLTGAQAGSYTLTGLSGSMTVTPATVTIASGISTSDKVYDGTTTAAFHSNNVVLNGVIPADSANVQLSTNGAWLAFWNPNAGDNKNVSLHDFSLTGTEAANYAIDYSPIKANITTRPITITAVSNSKVYNGTTSASATPTLDSGTIADNQTATYSETYDNANVGTGKTLTPSVTIKDAGDVDVTANYAVTANTVTTGSITLRTAPYARNRNVPLRIAISDLLSQATDNGGSGLTLASVTSPSAQLAAITANATHVLYTPGVNGNVSDSFTYTVNPGGGSGTVSITMSPDPSGQSANIVAYGVDGDQHPTMTFAGIPNFQYDIQHATSVDGTYTNQTATNAPGNGIFSWTDTSVTMTEPGSHFYRTVAH